eukprot:jgi/Undpi1/164/HiC_scaffold_1.g00161.m1
MGSIAACGLLRGPAEVATTRHARALPTRTSETLPERKLQMASSSSAARLSWDSSHGRDNRGGSPGTVAEVKRTQRALDAATAATLRHLQQAQQDIAEAESAEKKAVEAAATAREASFRSSQAAAMGASATPRTLTRQQGINSLSKRPGDSAF